MDAVRGPMAFTSMESGQLATMPANHDYFGQAVTWSGLWNALSGVDQRRGYVACYRWLSLAWTKDLSDIFVLPSRHL